jgi:methyl-accepting chemotaxis protein
MNNEELIALNQQANQALEAGMNKFKEHASEGFDVMSLAMNPKKAIEKYGDAIGQIISGVEMVHQVNNEVVNRVVNGGA